MVTILPALRQVRKDLVKTLSRATIDRLCGDIGYRWRSGLLDPFHTVHLFILQVLHRNTAMTHLPHLSGEPFTASAYCQARQRLPVKLFQRLADTFAQQAAGSNDEHRWRGHRVFLADGSGFSMPDTAELQAHFGQPPGQRPGCGFPVGHFVALLNADTGLLRDVIVSPLRTHDMAHARKLHPALSTGDILVADRGFCSYAHLALLRQASLHAVVRVHQRQIIDFRPHRPCTADRKERGTPTSRWIRRLGRRDQLVEWRKPQTKPRWMTAKEFAELPETLLVREIRVQIREAGCRVRTVTLVTTLLDPQRYPAAEIAGLYRMRWQVEVDLRDLKITLGMDALKGQSVDIVTKEVQVYILVYNLIRLVMLKAARHQRVHPSRISFLDALRYVQPPKPASAMPDLVVNPQRAGRVEPRCIKRRPKEYPLMRQPRKELRKRLKRQRHAA